MGTVVAKCFLSAGSFTRDHYLLSAILVYPDIHVARSFLSACSWLEQRLARRYSPHHAVGGTGCFVCRWDRSQHEDRRWGRYPQPGCLCRASAGVHVLRFIWPTRIILRFSTSLALVYPG